MTAVTAVTVEELGPASLGFPFNGAALAGNRLVISSRNLVPTRLAVYDLDTGRASTGPQVPTGSGAWGMTALDDVVYLGQAGARGADVLYRLDLATQTLAAVARLDADYVWSLAASAGGIYGVTGAADTVVHYDPRSGQVTDLGLTQPGDGLRSIALSGEDLLYGGNRAGRASLRTARLGTAPEPRSVLPPELAEHLTVYSLAAGEGMIAAGTQGPGASRPAVALLDAGSLAPVHVVALPAEESLVDTVAVAADAVWATARPSGALWRIDRATGSAERVTVGVLGSETRALFVRGQLVIGVSAAQRVWTWDVEERRLEVVDLLERGLEPGEEQSQSASAGNGTVAIGGNFGLQVHDVAAGRSRRWFVPGEPKDQVVVEQRRYLALYPVAQLWAAELDIDLAPSPVAQLPVTQNRPNCLHWDATTRLLCCGTSSDSLGGGALHLYRPGPGTVETFVDPLGPGQSVSRITSAEGVAYLAGGAADPALVAFDLAGRRPLWRLDRLGTGIGAVTGLVVRGRELYAFTADGWLAVVNLDTRAASAQRLRQTGGRMLPFGDDLTAVDRSALLDIDPVTRRAVPVLEGLDPAVWGHPFLAVDGGARYLLRGTTLLRVTT